MHVRRILSTQKRWTSEGACPPCARVLLTFPALSLPFLPSLVPLADKWAQIQHESGTNWDRTPRAPPHVPSIVPHDAWYRGELVNEETGRPPALCRPEGAIRGDQVGDQYAPDLKHRDTCERQHLSDG